MFTAVKLLQVKSGLYCIYQLRQHEKWQPINLSKAVRKLALRFILYLHYTYIVQVKNAWA